MCGPGFYTRDWKDHELPQITEAEHYDHCLVSIFY